MENSSQGLSMLDPEHKVVVTGEEHHQPALAGYAPRADGRARRVAVELRFTRAGRIEVLLDRRRVGELTTLMSQRYGRHVNAILARGQRPGAVGLVVNGRRGVEMELRLPDAGAEIADATTPMPPAPRPAPPGPDAGRPPRGPRGRFRKPLLIGGGVFALLVVVGSVVGGGDDERDAGTSTVAAAAVPAVRPAPTSTPPVATLDPEPEVDLDRRPVVAPQPAATRPVEPRTGESRVQPDPEPQRLVAPPQPEPEPRPSPAPEPAPEPEPEPEPRPVDSGGSVSYENCDAVRAAGAAPILVGEPGYSRKLDRDGDGIGCEN